MRFIIGLIIFWISIIGIKKFIEDKLTIDKIFSLPLAFTFVGISMFIAGILNMMKISAILIVVLSFSYLTQKIIKKKIDIKDLKKPSNIIMILIFSYITIIGVGMHLTHYDNFSHWGLIIKNMFIGNALPNFENTTIMFKGYQPGSACFIYFFGLLCGKTEGSMIIAQNYLIFAFLTPLLGFIKKENKCLKRIMFIAFYIFIMTISIKFSDLLVDSLLATVTISAFSIIYHYKDNLKRGFLYSLPISIFLLLIKNTGLILAGFICLYILYVAYQNKSLKEGIKYVLITGLTLVITLLIWQNHVSLVYGSKALNSKHSLSTQNIILQLRTKGWKNIFMFIKDYAIHLFSLTNNHSNIFMIIINMSLLMFLIGKEKKAKKNIIELLVISNLIYLGYYVILGLMYLLSMPWGEAIVFAGYERYMSTIIIIIMGMIFMQLFKKNIKITGILITLLMLITIYFYKDNAIALIGEDHYENTIVEKYDKIINNLKLEKEKKYYIYSPSSKDDSGYLEFLSKYKLNSSDIEIIYNVKDIKEDGTLIVIDEDNEINDYLQNKDRVVQ